MAMKDDGNDKYGKGISQPGGAKTRAEASRTATAPVRTGPAGTGNPARKVGNSANGG